MKMFHCQNKPVYGMSEGLRGEEKVGVSESKEPNIYFYYYSFLG